ncbi:MAG: hypothetical protein IPH89_05680 [Bacteroidetes bacterium]|jgi:hypothetical protein|nr:hypothetical protein [Bacteroidota bacterium]
MKLKFLLFVFILNSYNSNSQIDSLNYVILDYFQLTYNKEDLAIFSSYGAYSGKAIKRTRSDKYSDPIIGEYWYRNGLRDGKWKGWYTSGEKWYECVYVKGKIVQYFEWNRSGKIIRKIVF